ncbi:MAG: prepilin-type N-terminal cleavage/methylation domain-containing protein [Polyangiales bacterium]
MTSSAQTRRHDGFTLVEVMIAIGIMTVGSLGILSMHQAVTQANRDARDMNNALVITETWIERVERDAQLWTAQGFNTIELQNTQYLQALAGQPVSSGWFRPGFIGTDSYAFTFAGDDTVVANDIKYCVNVRLGWIRQGSSARVDVRTYWLREGHLPGARAHPQWVDEGDFRTSACTAAAADGWDLGEAPNVNVIFASTIVTWLRRDAQ